MFQLCSSFEWILVLPPAQASRGPTKSERVGSMVGPRHKPSYIFCVLLFGRSLNTNEPRRTCDAGSSFMSAVLQCSM
ncbi:hypothetical protein C7974DRAFT_138258 [Boeremia exigua]|uniref:uncharacterized protein n=1 Tax=Boeremia exigua TaxID=749465 RepID=UPI001E8DB28A|nr:uncharacterized protein C7974DRAFT_138258 [Boeremia exigua]KAH6639755.1 hypothetical protein C7974DRAFT_138258 [Boeremia exigua]